LQCEFEWPWIPGIKKNVWNLSLGFVKGWVKIVQFYGWISNCNTLLIMEKSNLMLWKSCWKTFFFTKFRNIYLQSTIFTFSDGSDKSNVENLMHSQPSHSQAAQLIDHLLETPPLSLSLSLYFTLLLSLSHFFSLTLLSLFLPISCSLSLPSNPLYNNYKLYLLNILLFLRLIN
jgi:hypothetical protein